MGLFRSYLKKVSIPEAWVGLHADALVARQQAVEAAIKALRQWGELPVPKPAGGQAGRQPVADELELPPKGEEKARVRAAHEKAHELRQ